MAKRKGKSRNRIKDWQQRYHSEEGYEHDEDPHKSFIRREFKIPQRALSAGAENIDDLPRAEGMVLAQFPGGAVVRIGEDQLLCGIAGTYRPPDRASALALGDIVTVAMIRAEHLDGKVEIDKDRADGVILERQPRQTVLCRPQPVSGKRTDAYETGTFEKVIAANMDTLLIVSSSCQPPIRPGLIDRFLIIAERGELRPVLVVNKIDLARQDETALEQFRELGLEVFLTSATERRGLDQLVTRLRGGRSVLAGQSGTGKSTLVNAIVPGANAATREVRLKDKRGRHTTATATIYDLPGGGIVVDTPGIRELGMALDATELPWYFPEFEALAGQCKFRDCTHVHEPDCAVIAAAESGRIPRRRYASYLRILETIEDRRG